MRKFIAILLSIASLWVFVACGDSNAESSEDSPKDFAKDSKKSENLESSTESTPIMQQDSSSNKSQVSCNTNAESKLYNEWVNDWRDSESAALCNDFESAECVEFIKENCGSYENSKDYQSCKQFVIKSNTGAYHNYAYITSTNGVITDMIASCDIAGLQKMIDDEKVGISEILSFQSSQGSYVNMVLGDVYSINPLMIEFLLDNKMMNFDELDNIDEFLQVATQRLENAKAQSDKKGIENYERIIDLIRQVFSLNYSDITESNDDMGFTLMAFDKNSTIIQTYAKLARTYAPKPNDNELDLAGEACEGLESKIEQGVNFTSKLNVKYIWSDNKLVIRRNCWGGGTYEFILEQSKDGVKVVRNGSWD